MKNEESEFRELVKELKQCVAVKDMEIEKRIISTRNNLT